MSKVSFRRIVASEVSDRLAAVGFEGPFFQSPGVDYRRPVGADRQIILFQMEMGPQVGPTRGFTVTLYGDERGRRMVRLGELLRWPGLSGWWHFDSEASLREWLRFLLDHGLEPALRWFDGDEGEAAWARLELRHKRYLYMLRSFGVEDPMDPWQASKAMDAWATVVSPHDPRFQAWLSVSDDEL